MKRWIGRMPACQASSRLILLCDWNTERLRRCRHRSRPGHHQHGQEESDRRDHLAGRQLLQTERLTQKSRTTMIRTKQVVISKTAGARLSTVSISMIFSDESALPDWSTRPDRTSGTGARPERRARRWGWEPSLSLMIVGEAPDLSPGNAISRWPLVDIGNLGSDRGAAGGWPQTEACGTHRTIAHHNGRNESREPADCIIPVICLSRPWLFGSCSALPAHCALVDSRRSVSRHSVVAAETRDTGSVAHCANTWRKLP